MMEFQDAMSRRGPYFIKSYHHLKVLGSFFDPVTAAAVVVRSSADRPPTYNGGTRNDRLCQFCQCLAMFFSAFRKKKQGLLSQSKHTKSERNERMLHNCARTMGGQGYP